MDDQTNKQNEQSDEIPEFFQEKKEKPKSYKKLFGLKKKICQDRTSKKR